MTSTLTTNPALIGTWRADPVHSTVSFKVAYLGVSLFGSDFKNLEAALGVTENDINLSGKIAVDTIQVLEPAQRGHLLSQEFFDIENHPYLSFKSKDLVFDGDKVSGKGFLTIKGIEKEVQIEGELAGPITDAYNKQRIGLNLHTSVDRRDFDLKWNMDLPSGKKALANKVDIQVNIQATQ